MVVDRDKVSKAGLEYLRRGQFDQSAREYRRLLAEDPDDLRTLSSLGELYGQLGQTQRAVETYKKIADLQEASQAYLKAVAALRNALEHVPDDLKLGKRLAALLEELALDEDASREYEQLEKAATVAGDDELATSVLTSLCGIWREDDERLASILCRLAEVWQRRGFDEEAQAQWRKALLIYERLQNLDKQIHVGEKLLAVIASDTDAAQIVARAHISGQSWQKALIILASCFAHAPEDGDTLTMIAEALTGLGKVEEANGVRLELARLNMGEGKLDETEAALRGILRLDTQGWADPQAREARAMLEQTAARRGAKNYDESLAAKDLSLEDKTSALLKRAKEYICRGDVEQALSAAQSALVLRPGLVAGLIMQHTLLLRQGQVRKGQAAMLAAAEGAVELGETATAQVFLRELVAADPSNNEANALLRRVDPWSAIGLSGLSVVAPRNTIGKSPELPRLGVFAPQTPPPKAAPIVDAAITAEVFIDEADIPAVADDEPGDDPWEDTEAVVSSTNNGAVFVDTDVAIDLDFDVETNFDDIGTARIIDGAYTATGLQFAGFSAHVSDSDIGGTGTGTGTEILDGEATFIDEEILPAETESKVDISVMSLTPEIVPAPVVVSPPPVVAPPPVVEPNSVRGARFEALEEGTVDEALQFFDDMQVGEDGIGAAQPVPVEDGFSPDGIGSQDARAHYDLGVAYWEMGRYEAAIAELRLSLSSMPEQAETMIGICKRQNGNFDGAIGHFRRALDHAGQDPEKRVALLYELGITCAEGNRADDAREYFGTVAALDADFRDVKKRLGA